MTKAWLKLKKGETGTDKRQANCFRFSGYTFDSATGQATLSYDVDGRALHEIITFPWAPWPVDASRQAAFFNALELLHLVAGISYYKAGLAAHIDTGGSRVDEDMASFLNTLYLDGLAEFAYVNELDLSGLIDFEVTAGRTRDANDPSGDGEAASPTESYNLDLPERALVAMGGGKDSLVCLQMLKDAGVEHQPVCIGGSPLIGETVKAAGLPLIRIQRELSTGLAEMNAAGAWNGHVPITAINSAILLCAGLLYGYRHIVFANEASANEATLTDGQGREVNHQYSKSFAFERAFGELVRHHVSPDVEYFSLLRPYGEIAISHKFSRMTEFHQVFSSCNRNFHQDGPHITGRWCRDCPKCRFAALALAPFLSPEQLLAIQGAELLDQKDQLRGYKALCGLDEQKPFECVGSIEECRAALRFLSRDTRWRGKYVVSSLAGLPEIMQAADLVLQPDFASEHRIPAVILEKLRAPA